MATSLLDEWTEEKCIQLIREYRARPILWDQKDPSFFKKTMKPLAWQEIAISVNISAEQCKHKMIILMSSFRREKAKIMHSIKNLTDPSQVYKSTWFAFKEMAFLLDKDSERKRQLNDSDEVDEDDGHVSANCTKAKLLSHHLDTLSAPSAKRARQSPSVRNELTQKVGNKEREEICLPRLQPRPGPSCVRNISPDRAEEIQSFVTFIYSKMKTYSERTKNAVQQAICEIIFKADQNRCNNNDSYNNYNFLNEDFTIIDDEPETLNRQVLIDETVIKIENGSDTEWDSD